MKFGALTLPLGAAREPFADVIAASVARDHCDTLDDVLRQIEDGHAVAWVASEDDKIVGAVVTEILEGGKARQCFIRHCAGDRLDDWLEFLAVIERWAEAEGCQSIELIGRPGWERRLGWEKSAVVLRKGLNGVH